MRYFELFHLVILLILTQVFVSGRSSADGLPIVEKIDGDRIVIIRGPKGNREVQKGGEVQEGELIKTGPRASARIKFSDGSRLLVGKATEVVIEKPRDGTQWTELKEGQVRGIIAHPEKSAQAAAGTKPPPPKFGIRSRSAVMGVRGTDFVFGVGQQAADVHTLQGTVEVAKDEPTLMEGRGTLVQKNEAVTAKDGQISDVKKFDSGKYLKDIQATMPSFIKLTRGLDGEVSYQRPPEIEEPKPGWLRLLEFRTFGVYAKQRKIAGEVYSAGLSWNPTLELLGPFALRANLSVFPLKDTKDAKFFATQYGLSGCFSLLRPLIFELGFGGEVLSAHQGRPGNAMLAHVGWQLSQFDFLERIFVAMSVYERPVPESIGQSYHGRTQGITQIFAGVGLHL